MSENAPASRRERSPSLLKKIGKVLSSGGYNLLSNDPWGDPIHLTPEQIQGKTGFGLVVTFTGFAREGEISPDYHEEFDRLRQEYGEGNVISSLYQEKGKLELGIFMRQAVIDQARETAVGSHLEPN